MIGRNMKLISSTSCTILRPLFSAALEIPVNTGGSAPLALAALLLDSFECFVVSYSLRGYPRMLRMKRLDD